MEVNNSKGLLHYFVTHSVFTVSCWHPAQLPRWITTPCQLSPTVYSLYSQLPSISGVLRPQSKDALWRREKDPLTRNLIYTIFNKLVQTLASLTEHSLPIYNKLRKIRYEPQQAITSRNVRYKSDIVKSFCRNLTGSFYTEQSSVWCTALFIAVPWQQRFTVTRCLHLREQIYKTSQARRI